MHILRLGIFFNRNGTRGRTTSHISPTHTTKFPRRCDAFARATNPPKDIHREKRNNMQQKNLLLLLSLALLSGFHCIATFIIIFVWQVFLFLIYCKQVEEHNRKLIPWRKIGSKFLVFVVFPVLLLTAHCKIRN